MPRACCDLGGIWQWLSLPSVWGLLVETVWLRGAVLDLPGATVIQVINSNQPISNIGNQCSHSLDSLLGNTAISGLV